MRKPKGSTDPAHRVLQETIRLSNRPVESLKEPLAPTGPPPEERERRAWEAATTPSPEDAPESAH
jgi:hypothetical protein